MSSPTTLAARLVAVIAVLIALTALLPSTVGACSCMPTHPQTHYCNSDYVIIARILRQRTTTHQIIYKIEIKKSFKMNDRAKGYLREGKLTTHVESSMCGTHLQVGKLYVIAGTSAQVSLCSYAQLYGNLSIVQRRGFAGGYRKGCFCQIETIPFMKSGCYWNPWEQCETNFGACVPSRGGFNASGVATKCHWRSSPAYNECVNMP